MKMSYNESIWVSRYFKKKSVKSDQIGNRLNFFVKEDYVNTTCAQFGGMRRELVERQIQNVYLQGSYVPAIYTGLTLAVFLLGIAWLKAGFQKDKFVLLLGPTRLRIRWAIKTLEWQAPILIDNDDEKNQDE
jgi:hypothetical protein